MSEAPEHCLHFEVVITTAMHAAVRRALVRRTLPRTVAVVTVAALVPFILDLANGDLIPALITLAMLCGIVFFVVRRTTSRSVAKTYPVGLPVATTFGTADVAVRGPHVRVSQPYRELAPPTVRAGVVVFPGTASRRRAWLVPVELCPPEAIELIHKANDQQVEPESPNPIMFTETIVADSGMVGRLAAAAFWVGRRSYTGVVVSLIPVLLGLALASDGSRWWLMLGLAVIPWHWYMLRSLRRALAKQYPSGSVSAARMTDTSLILHNRGAVQEWPYADFSRIYVSGHAVVLRDRLQKQCLYVMPRELFTAENLDQLRSEIAS